MRAIKIDDISKIVCKYHNLDFSELVNKTRKREIIQARQQAMYYSKEETKLSLADIGGYYGGKDHATVLHACKSVINLNDVDKKYSKEMDNIGYLIKEFKKPKPRANPLTAHQNKSLFNRSGLKRRIL